MNDIAVKEIETLRNKLRDKNKQIVGNRNFIRIGDFTYYGNISINAWDDKTKLSIGKYCSIADGVSFVLGGNHKTEWISTYPFNVLMPSYNKIKGHPATKGDINVGNDVWIASGAKILSGVSIGDGAVVAANALVSSDVEPYSIAGGVPARHIKYRFSQDVIDKLLEMRWWDWKDEIVAVVVPLLQSSDIDELWDMYQWMKETGIEY